MHCSGIEALLHLLAEAGVRHVFGNPGTTELPLVDALLRQVQPGQPPQPGDEPPLTLKHQIEYILGLQEVPVIAMADGFGQASRQLAVVNLHISCGLGNGLGMIYNAYRAGTPMLVTVGQQDRRLAFEEPILWSDMVSVAKPWTKWSAEINRVQDIPSAVRRAIQTALTPPTGPVFLSLPIDLQSERAELDVTPAAPLDHHTRPPAAALQRAAEILAAAKNPAILTGSRVVENDAVAELVKLAEVLGAPVMHESGTTHGRLGFAVDHPLSALGLPLWSPEVAKRLDEFDVLLVTGCDLLRQYIYHDPPRPIPEHVKIIQLDEDQWQIGKNYPVEVGLLGATKPGLAELSSLVASRQTAEQSAAAKKRGADRAELHRRQREELIAQAGRERATRPLTPLTLMSTLANVLPPDVAVIEEAVTTTNTTLERLGAIKNPSGYFGHRGWALGWGLGCALGVKLAWPNRPVLAVLGEGAAMYGIQGLWTAAHYRIPVTFVICNNANYQILKVCGQQLDLPTSRHGRWLGMDLVGPEVDYLKLSESLGVRARRISEPEEIAEAVRTSLAGDTPQLIEVPIQRMTPKRLNYG